MRKKQQAAGHLQFPLKEALALRNDSPENNKKILGALGRLAPPDGAGVDYNAMIVRHVGGDHEKFQSAPAEQRNRSRVSGADRHRADYLNSMTDINYFAPRELIVSWQTSKDHLMDKFVIA